MNRRGQALVEFVLILPVFLLILFTIVDFGNFLAKKNQLETESTDIVLLLRNGKSAEEVAKSYSKIKIEESVFEEKYNKIKISENITLINPLLYKILGNPCIVEVERIVPRDE
ncbi:MAG: pilus assembly protein [Bacilli bacterium]|nr:pilus assembly protein [Bacilli bacterium]